MTTNLNPMFHPYKATPQNIKIPKEPKPRKKRKDAKKDIKIPLTIEQKKFVRMASFARKMPVTSFVSELIIEGLNISYIKFCTEEEEYFSKSTENVHCKLPQHYHDQLHELAIEWNVSIRRAGHRILFYMLQKGRDKSSICI